MEADLFSANLQGTSLFNAVFAGTNLTKTEFSGVEVGNTVFGSYDSSQAISLNKVIHMWPSTIGEDTIAQSKGKIPDLFS